MPSPTTSLLKRAVHRHQPASREGVLERLFTLWFRGFVYTQIWEDPRVDAEALRLDASSRVLTISSAGCNVLNYLLHQPERVVALDLNTAHMSLTRLKIAALRHLPDYPTFFRFFGAANHPDNPRLYYTYLRPHLDETTRAFWERPPYAGGLAGEPRIHYFAKNLYNYGKLGLFQRFSSLVARAVLRRRPSELLAATTMDEQRAFFDEVIAPFFDNYLVRQISQMPATVYSLGIPPSQHRIMADESGADIIDLYRARLKKLTCGFPLSDNYFAWQAFGRCYDCEHKEAVPPYLKEANYALLRYGLDRIETHITSFADFLHQQPDSSFDSFVLLDAMDWMTPATITDLWQSIARVGAPGARIIFRTAGTPSPIETALPGDLRRRFVYERERSERLHEHDRSAIYGMFHCYVLAA